MSEFIFAESPITAWREVQVTVPTDEGFTTQTMRMLMVACSKEELVVLAEAEADAVFGPRDQRESDQRKDPVADFLVRRITDWQGVARAAGEGETTKVSFSESSLRTLLAIPYVQAAVVAAYTTFVRGGKGEKDARRKNY